ncbi:type IV pilus biogenesis/stability protein PilW [Burkholderiaceae bacterium FT117]|uniref:type IV pilus biogenesis/stability protein PilW n=1 Tax=Zeimonas sediminis TaxID=2944268 RepID=UPI002342FB76|nr:type IV pilus biogenesis/stability protein PilW [Zeimonas sediminis]MCM5571936.1 type IV pilus biogenesis/stability protein PilW [Zeimonas sediminis]
MTGADRFFAPGSGIAQRLVALLATVLVALLAGCAADGRPGAGQAESSRDGSVAVVPGSGEESDARRRARIRVELAAGYYQQRNYQVALDEIGQALRADPEYPGAFGMLGLVYMALNDRERAEESFQRGLRLAPNDANLNNNYGWFLCQTGRERDSIARFEQALRDPLYQTPTMPLHNAGICALRLGDEKTAESYFLRAFQVDATNPVAMFNLGQIYLKRGDLERARFHAQRLVNTFEPSAQTLWLALKVERALGNRDAEASLGAQLRRRFPDSPEAGLLAARRYSE